MTCLSNSFIKKCARETGFDLCGIVRPKEVSFPHHTMDKWLAEGKHAGMDWLTRNNCLRRNPALLTEDAASIIVCGIGYLRQTHAPGIARYAQGKDYHFVIKNMLGELLQKLNCSGQLVSGRCFTDSAPIAERYWAVEAGLGWIGRNGLLINRQKGSFLLLGELIINCKTDTYDTPNPFNGCGNCRRCIDNCPGKALDGQSPLDARRCTSYLTIEHKKTFTKTEQDILRRSRPFFFGCDICQEICPWNKKAIREITPEISEKTSALFSSDEYNFSLTLSEWLALDEEQFRQYKKTPLSRPGLENLKRNIIASTDNLTLPETSESLQT